MMFSDVLEHLLPLVKVPACMISKMCPHLQVASLAHKKTIIYIPLDRPGLFPCMSPIGKAMQLISITGQRGGLSLALLLQHFCIDWPQTSVLALQLCR